MNALKKDLQELEVEMGDYTLNIDYSLLQSIGWLQQIPRQLTPEVEEICNEIHPKPYSWAFWGGGVCHRRIQGIGSQMDRKHG